MQTFIIILTTVLSSAVITLIGMRYGYRLALRDTIRKAATASKTETSGSETPIHATMTRDYPYASRLITTPVESWGDV